MFHVLRLPLLGCLLGGTGCQACRQPLRRISAKATTAS